MDAGWLLCRVMRHSVRDGSEQSESCHSSKASSTLHGRTNPKQRSDRRVGKGLHSELIHSIRIRDVSQVKACLDAEPCLVYTTYGVRNGGWWRILTGRGVTCVEVTPLVACIIMPRLRQEPADTGDEVESELLSPAAAAAAAGCNDEDLVVEIMRVLLDAGSDADGVNLVRTGRRGRHTTTTRGSFTALHFSVFYELAGVTDLLLHYLTVSAINLPDQYGNTPLHYATFLGNEEIVEMLFNAGAKESLVNNVGVSPADIAFLLHMDVGGPDQMTAACYPVTVPVGAGVVTPRPDGDGTRGACTEVITRANHMEGGPAVMTDVVVKNGENVSRDRVESYNLRLLAALSTNSASAAASSTCADAREILV